MIHAIGDTGINTGQTRGDQGSMVWDPFTGKYYTAGNVPKNTFNSTNYAQTTNSTGTAKVGPPPTPTAAPPSECTGTPPYPFYCFQQSGLAKTSAHSVQATNDAENQQAWRVYQEDLERYRTGGLAKPPAPPVYKEVNYEALATDIERRLQILQNEWNDAPHDPIVKAASDQAIQKINTLAQQQGTTQKPAAGPTPTHEQPTTPPANPTQFQKAIDWVKHNPLLAAAIGAAVLYAAKESQ